MFNIILFQPEIPPNTGNIIRLCANTNSTLHLIEPLGFTLEEKQLKRAGLDYHALAQVRIHQTLDHCLQLFTKDRIFALTTKGKTNYTTPSFTPNDAFIFGPESRGLPLALLDTFTAGQKLYIPQATQSRSLNLSNAVSILVYEAWRQNNFAIEEGT